MRSRMGRSITIPGEDASDEDRQSFKQRLRDKVTGLVELPAEGDSEGWGEFYKQLGRPDQIEDYTVTQEIVENVPTDVLKGYAEAALKANIPRDNFKAFMEQVAQEHQVAEQQQQKAYEEDMTALKGEWGLAFDERVTAAKGILDKFFPGAELDMTDLNSNLVKGLHAISQSLGGESPQIAQQSNGATLTVGEAKMQIAEIRNNPQHPYNNPADPNHKYAREKVQALYKQAFPSNESVDGYQTIGIG